MFISYFSIVPFRNFPLSFLHRKLYFRVIYRASIINLSMAVRNKTLVYAFLVDFGSIVQVDSSDVYLLNEKMYTVPQFAVRATLTGLAPFNSSTWSAAAVTNFYKLVEERVLLAKVTNVDNLNKTLYLHLGDYNSDTQHVKSVNCALVQNKFAKLITTSDLPKMAQNENKVYNLQFLLPSFDSIEAGLCPDTVLVANSLQEYVVKYQNK
ncbi:uncharacterized protein LOC143200679 isoform X3 [Rhynchophorus ferrugineus]|uniref:uncharacterized protein LOC143200679 isoform X3 n=1 Tax=Rhynchophorus ferrugineus TaxID=354439 RepID=UPI003FCD5E94